jgi:hypothetical protein
MPRRDSDDVPYSKRLVPISHRLRIALNVGTTGGNAHIDQMVRMLAVQLGMDVPILTPTISYLEGLLPKLEELLSGGRCPGITEGYYERVVRTGLYDPQLQDLAAILYDLDAGDKPLPPPVTPEDLFEKLSEAVEHEMVMRLIRAATRWKDEGVFDLSVEPPKKVWRSERQRIA